MLPIFYVSNIGHWLTFFCCGTVVNIQVSVFGTFINNAMECTVNVEIRLRLFANFHPCFMLCHRCLACRHATGYRRSPRVAGCAGCVHLASNPTVFCVQTQGVP